MAWQNGRWVDPNTGKPSETIFGRSREDIKTGRMSDAFNRAALRSDIDIAHGTNAMMGADSNTFAEMTAGEGSGYIMPKVRYAAARSASEGAGVQFEMERFPESRKAPVVEKAIASKPGQSPEIQGVTYDQVIAQKAIDDRRASELMQKHLQIAGSLGGYPIYVKKSDNPESDKVDNAARIDRLSVTNGLPVKSITSFAHDGTLDSYERAYKAANKGEPEMLTSKDVSNLRDLSDNLRGPQKIKVDSLLKTIEKKSQDNVKSIVSDLKTEIDKTPNMDSKTFGAKKAELIGKYAGTIIADRIDKETEKLRTPYMKQEMEISASADVAEAVRKERYVEGINSSLIINQNMYVDFLTKPENMYGYDRKQAEEDVFSVSIGDPDAVARYMDFVRNSDGVAVPKSDGGWEYQEESPKTKSRRKDEAENKSTKAFMEGKNIDVNRPGDVALARKLGASNADMKLLELLDDNKKFEFENATTKDSWGHTLSGDKVVSGIVSSVSSELNNVGPGGKDIDISTAVRNAIRKAVKEKRILSSDIQGGEDGAANSFLASYKDLIRAGLSDLARTKESSIRNKLGVLLAPEKDRRLKIMAELAPSEAQLADIAKKFKPSDDLDEFSKRSAEGIFKQAGIDPSDAVGSMVLEEGKAKIFDVKNKIMAAVAKEQDVKLGSSKGVFNEFRNKVASEQDPKRVYELTGGMAKTPEDIDNMLMASAMHPVEIGEKTIYLMNPDHAKAIEGATNPVVIKNILAQAMYGNIIPYNAIMNANGRGGPQNKEKSPAVAEDSKMDKSYADAINEEYANIDFRDGSGNLTPSYYAHNADSIGYFKSTGNPHSVTDVNRFYENAESASLYKPPVLSRQSRVADIKSLKDAAGPELSEAIDYAESRDKDMVSQVLYKDISSKERKALLLMMHDKYVKGLVGVIDSSVVEDQERNPKISPYIRELKNAVNSASGGDVSGLMYDGGGDSETYDLANAAAKVSEYSSDEDKIDMASAIYKLMNQIETENSASKGKLGKYRKEGRLYRETMKALSYSFNKILEHHSLYDSVKKDMQERVARELITPSSNMYPPRTTGPIMKGGIPQDWDVKMELLRRITGIEPSNPEKDYEMMNDIRNLPPN